MKPKSASIIVLKRSNMTIWRTSWQIKGFTDSLFGLFGRNFARLKLHHLTSHL